MCHVSARRLSIYNFAWGLLKASNLQAGSKILKEIIGTPNLSMKKKNSKKNCVSYLKSGKRPKICPDGICRPDPNPKKNYKNIKSTNQNEIFPKKNMFSTLKVYRSKKFVWGLPDGICGLDPKS
jgi:hypothetical protein